MHASLRFPQQSWVQKQLFQQHVCQWMGATLQKLGDRLGPSRRSHLVGRGVRVAEETGRHNS